MIRVRRKNQIVTRTVLREVLSTVVDDMGCAKRPRSDHIPRAAYGCYFGPEPFCNLDSKCTHSTRRAIDQNLLTWPDPSLVAKTLKSSDCRHRHSCCVFKRKVGGFQRQTIFGRTRIVGKGSETNSSSEYLVPSPKLLHVAAHRLNTPR